MQINFSPEIDGCVTQITYRLATLGREEQATVLRAVSERLEDLRAKQVYDDVVSEKMTTGSSKEIMADLKANYGI
jgi:hypothetical protein